METLKRLARISRATGRSQAQLLARIVEDAVNGSDSEQVLAEKLR